MLNLSLGERSSDAETFRHRQAIRDDRLPKLLISIHDDVSGIEQPRLGQVGDRTAASVGAQDGISERQNLALISHRP